MKKIFLRVLLWFLQVLFLQYTNIQALYSKVTRLVDDFVALLLGGKENYVRTKLSQITKQPKHLIFSIQDSSDNFQLFSQHLSRIVLLLASTKTYIFTLYDASGMLQKDFPAFLEILKQNCIANIPSRKIFMLNPNKGSQSIYLLNDKKEENAKEYLLDSIPSGLLEEGASPFIINILGPLDGYSDFLKNVNSKAQGSKLNLEELRPNLSCNKALKLLNMLNIKLSVQEYDTSLLQVFSENLDSCLGVPFDLLPNAEITFQKNFRKYDSLSVLKAYEEFSQTKQRRGK